MLENKETTADAVQIVCHSHTEIILMAVAAALVGYLTLYLAFFDSAGVL